MTRYSLLLLPGDGIGIEVVAEVKKVIGWIEKFKGLKFTLHEDKIGGAAIDAFGTPLREETVEMAKSVDAVMLGAVGGPQWDQVDYAIRPEAGLLKIRKDLGLFANLRPAIVFDALIDASTLKPDIIKGLDILIIRELTGGIYFGEPRGIFDIGNGLRKGINTQVYTTPEIHRVAAVAFEMARKRSNKVTSAEKANVMDSGKLWREEITTLHAQHYSDIKLEHMYADNMAMQLLKNPKQFDVIVTDNLFGDILSDEAAMLTGSLGMLPSASLGAPLNTGKRHALYEPVHGSAPDIAGKNIANPLATILSFAMCLRYSLNQGDLATQLEQSVQRVLAKGFRTSDIMAEGCTKLTTSDMGNAVINDLTQTLEKAA